MNQKKYAVFTMDVERFSDTECISASGIRVDEDLMDGFDEYLKILDRYGIKSTLFTVGDLAPRIVDRLRPHIENGHSLAMHSYSHVAPMAVPLEQFREKTRRAKAWMRELFGTEVVGFRAPCFSMDKARLDVLQELGFCYDSSHLDFSAARHTVSLDLSDFDQLRDEVYCRNGFFERGISADRNTCKRRCACRADLAASYTQAIVQGIVKKTDMALSTKAKGVSTLVLAGGVAANSHIRSALSRLCDKRGIRFIVPDRHLCGDNAAMIAAAGYFEYQKGTRADTSLNASASDYI